MQQFNLTIGLNDRYTHKQIIPTQKAKQIITTTILKYTDGYTIYTTDGAYRHSQSKHLIKEKSIRVELMYTSQNAVLSIINELKAPTHLNQETIMLEIINNNAQYV